VAADETVVVSEALRRGVAISGLSRHYAHGNDSRYSGHSVGGYQSNSRRSAPSGLVMGFGAIAAAALPAAIEIVAATIIDVAGGASP
jgi:hypothetical protein